MLGRKAEVDRPSRGAISSVSPVFWFCTGLDEMRLVRERRCWRACAIACCELDRRERVVALPDAGGDRIAEIPLAMLVAVVLARRSAAASTSRDGSDPGQLALDVEAGLAPKPAHERKRAVSSMSSRWRACSSRCRTDTTIDLYMSTGAVAAGLVVAEAMRLPRDLRRSRGRKIACGRPCACPTRAREREERLDRRAPAGTRRAAGRFSSGLSGDSL
jgi:hypothetical protein